jgi:hypothetical protein
MDKFSAISLFDFFSFLVPGFILQATIVLCWQQSGFFFTFGFSFITENDALLFVALSITAYLLGHALHYISTQFSWVGASQLQRSVSSNSLLQKEKHLAASLNKISSEKFGFAFLNKEGKPEQEETDRFFEISFRILENNGLLQTSRNLQVQYIMFSNVYTALAVSAVLCLVTIIVVIFKPADPAAIKYLLVLTAIAGLLAVGFLEIAAQRRKLFIKTVWWQFYSFYFHPLTPKSE